MSQDKSSSVQCKLVLLGDSAVGKSSLVMRFVQGKFSEFHNVTIGAAFLTQTVPLEDGTTIKYEIWDTAGQERFQSLAPMYYRGAAAAIVAYSITDKDTFTRAQHWVKELQLQGNPNIVICLAGNKVDLEEHRAVEKEEVQAYASDNGLLFFETSAKTSAKVNEMFTEIAKKLAKPKVGGIPSRGAPGIIVSDKPKSQGAKQETGCNC